MSSRTGRRLLLPAVALLVLPLTASSTGAAAVRVGTVGSGDLREGDCLQSLKLGDVPKVLDLVSCDSPHRGEVLAVVRLAGPRTYDVPEIERRAVDLCRQELRSIAPFALEDDAAHLYWLQPARTAWKAGDREVGCVVVTERASTTTIRNRWSGARSLD